MLYPNPPKQYQNKDIRHNTKPKHNQKTGLAPLVLEGSLGIQSTRPPAEKLPDMENLFRDAPIVVLGKVLVLPIEQCSQQAVHKKGRTHAPNKTARLEKRNTTRDDTKRPEISKPLDD